MCANKMTMSARALFPLAWVYNDYVLRKTGQIE